MIFHRTNFHNMRKLRGFVILNKDRTFNSILTLVVIFHYFPLFCTHKSKSFPNWFFSILLCRRLNGSCKIEVKEYEFEMKFLWFLWFLNKIKYLFTETEIWVRGNQGFVYDTKRQYTLNIECADQRNNDSAEFYVYILRNMPPYFPNLQGNSMVTVNEYSVLRYHATI